MQITYTGSNADLHRMLRQLAQVLAGRAPDPYGLVQSVQLRCGVALLSQVQQDFITKSRGGTGRDGIRWPDLQVSTVANRRTTAVERKAAGVTGKRVSGLLTPAQDKRWREVYGRTLAQIRGFVGDEQAARGKAASIAWATVKREGAKTKLEVFGRRKVDILRDTGELLRSLSPGVENRPSKAPGQVFDVNTLGVVRVGTNKKPWHHAGTRRGLPARPLWPLDGRIPEAWWPAIHAAATRGLMLVAAQLAQQGVRL